MIRFQITTTPLPGVLGTNPVAINSAAKLLTDHPRLDIQNDSGNRYKGKGGTYGRIIEAKVLNKTKPKPKPRLDATDKMVLAERCWQRIVHKTDGDEEAVQAIIELIEYVERKYSNE